MPVMESVERQRRALKIEYDRLNDQLTAARNAWTIETNPVRRLQFEAQMAELQQAIGPIERQLDSLESQPVTDALLSLDHADQVRSFVAFTKKQKAGAFLVQSTSPYGMSWLLKRLVRNLRENMISEPIQVALSRKIIPSGLKELWSEVERKVNSGPRLRTTAEIIQSVCKKLETQHVVIVFDEINIMPESYITDLIDNLWTPLAHAAQQQRSEYLLLMFLTDYSEPVGAWGFRHAEKLDTWQEHIPLRLPRFTRFPKPALKIWVESQVDLLPPEYTESDQIEITVEAILSESGQGEPDKIAEYIGLLCDCDLEGDDSWLRL